MTSKDLQITSINPDCLTFLNDVELDDWTRDQFIAAGEDAGKVKYLSQWVMGKLAFYYNKKFGDLKDFAQSIHQEEYSVRSYYWVYKKIVEDNPDYVPDGHLTWGALQILARCEHPVQKIEELSSEGKISMKEAYRAVKEEESKKEGRPLVPSKPKVKIVLNKDVNQWELDIAQEDFDRLYWLGKFKERFKKHLEKVKNW